MDAEPRLPVSPYSDPAASNVYLAPDANEVESSFFSSNPASCRILTVSTPISGGAAFVSSKIVIYPETIRIC